MTANMALLSPATAGTAAVPAAAINRPSTQVVSSSLSPLDSIKSARASLRLPRTAAAAGSTAVNTLRTRKWKVSCEVALKPDSKPSSSSSSAESDSPSVSGEGDGPDGGPARIGARVRVTVPLKVYHVPRVPEVDLTGMEGELKQYVAEFKGKRISANLPFKVQFVKEIEGRGPVKFFAHLKEDEFEYV
ncbi:ferredoxin-thioredoxin reductase, variable chain, chloroplastic [Eucalyptus grandis]|uniref:ferredoxin-thioredoxin reductase, variable chain, chloroplastic n=1 Tax=Eucalyptus grandis TaxID=71139 RepID=UPI00192F06D2|nr:ferredoxin-thioredoxin reductase, variable chain, chloroplastic [Eucalyptus grandis]